MVAEPLVLQSEFLWRLSYQVNLIPFSYGYRSPFLPKNQINAYFKLFMNLLHIFY